MTTIELERSWKKGKEIGDPGGFGQVFEAEADDGSSAVIKLIPKEPGASRELLFEEISGLPNIIPILDSGEWGHYYVLVMPRAEMSLRQHLEDSGGKLVVDEAVGVLTDVAEALAALDATVVHRDIKPENVLLYEDHWCVADFGIARYAEAATESETRKFSMSAPYAAPEQWRGERATSAADVYAFGIMAFELLQGERPFPGPDFRKQHLTEAAVAVEDCPPGLSSLVNECLYKPASARPTPANILARLQGSKKPLSAAAEKLRSVNAVVVQEQSEESARKSAATSKEENRRELLAAAEDSFHQILESLRVRALEAAPSTKVLATRAGLTLRLAQGALIVDSLVAAPADCLAAFDYAAPFDVVAYTAIAACKPRDRYDYEGRAHSLWYCDAHDEGVYRWYELAFMISPLIAQRPTLDPFALPPTDEYAGPAFTPVSDVRQIAWQAVPFDQGDEAQFFERWLEWFAAAANGSLNQPSHMPENSGGTFRAPRKRPR